MHFKRIQTTVRPNWAATPGGNIDAPSVGTSARAHQRWGYNVAS
jgi:hypothetical protein